MVTCSASRSPMVEWGRWDEAMECLNTLTLYLQKGVGNGIIAYTFAAVIVSCLFLFKYILL